MAALEKPPGPGHGVRERQKTRHRRSDAASAKKLAIAGLKLSMLQWFVAFITVGGEWFLMWQSSTWNGQDATFRMFDCLGIMLIFLNQPDEEIEGQGRLRFTVR